MRKEIFILFIFMILITGCGASTHDNINNDKNSNIEVITEITTQLSVDNTTEKEITNEEKEVTTTQTTLVEYNKDILYDAYKDALKVLIEEYILPDGSEVEHDLVPNSVAENDFAIIDIDSDGIDELLVAWTTASMAGMRFSVYQYDFSNNKIYEEVRDFPSVVFYDNGLLIVEAAHNQGWGSTIWPYSIYQYEASNDTYCRIGYAECWNKDIFADNFPDDVDSNRCGVVYTINYPGYDKDYYSQSEYDEFYESIMKGIDGGQANTIEIKYKKLTLENIDF